MVNVPDLPLLVFPQAMIVRPSGGPRGGGRSQGPGVERQKERLSPQFDRLEQAFEGERARLARDALGADPELVLVLETVGTITDFLKAVKNIEGMEWLGELDEDDIEPDEDFVSTNKDPDAPLDGQVFLILSNHQALLELLSLRDRYLEDASGPWQRGRTKWRELFAQLRTIRPWNAQDRLQGTGLLEDWRRRVAENAERVRLEVELWFRQQPHDQQRGEARIRELVQAEGGETISGYVRREIAYHGLLIDMPIGAVRTMLTQPETRLVACPQAMFFRPVGQMAGIIPPDAPRTTCMPPPHAPAPTGQPVVALLDGLPLANHLCLDKRLIIDDPDGWAATYGSQDRQHGTAMASLITCGDLSAGEQPLHLPLYVRPILQPDPRDPSNPKRESIPENILPVDLIHRAVVRLFEGDGLAPPVAPTVRVINLSIGDPSRPFDRILSPMARLLDWLSWEYKVLFVVSAGNYGDPIILDVPSQGFSQLSMDEVEALTLNAIISDASGRALLAPSEAVNAVTVGALHEDASTPPHLGLRHNLLQSSGLPSPLTRIGPGFNRAIKPEILHAGGRQTYTRRPATATSAVLHRSTAAGAPGQQVATPGTTQGKLDDTIFTQGTSNAAALTSRAAAQIYDVLLGLRQQPEGWRMSDRYTAMLLKALLVHSSRWGGSAEPIRRAFNFAASSRHNKLLLSRLLGYGRLEPQRVFSCTEQRATVLGWGEFSKKDAHRYSFPLPKSLASKRVSRTLTITLAWLTPTRVGRHRYRQAELSIEPPASGGLLRVKRMDADWQAVRRGTIQHEVLEGTDATAYVEGATLELLVNCRWPTGNASGMIVPYAIAVTLEVPIESAIPVYVEVSERIAPRTEIPIQQRNT